MNEKELIVGKKIKARRKEKHITQEELCKLTGISQGYISDLEKGKANNPTLELLEKIAKALNIPLAELTEGNNKLEVVTDGVFIHFVMNENNMTGSRIYKGDLITVRKQDFAETSDIAVISINGEYKLKRIKLYENKYILYNDNPSYAIDILDISDVIMIGIVVKVEFTP